MRKILVFLGLFALAVSLSACNNTSNKAPSGTGKSLEKSTESVYITPKKSSASTAQSDFSDKILEAKKEQVKNAIAEIQMMIDEEINKSSNY